MVGGGGSGSLKRMDIGALDPCTEGELIGLKAFCYIIFLSPAPTTQFSHCPLVHRPIG